MAEQPPAYEAPNGARNLPINLILPKNGIVIAEASKRTPVLCKPKILPLKSAVLEKLDAEEAERRQQQHDKKQGISTVAE
eukprot:m.200711 g.200711  ORF g.200711 m.200711 type:complete len:80 (+) comp32772_c1_seq2:311-550(+)